MKIYLSWMREDTVLSSYSTNSEFWKSKFEKNIARDVKEKRELEEAGWKAIVLWECEISTKKKREIRLPALEDEIKSQL